LDVKSGPRTCRASCAEHEYGELDAAERHLVDGVPSIAHDKQLAQSRTEQQFRRNATVGAANQHREGVLLEGDGETPLVIPRKSFRLVRQKVGVSFLHPRQCFVGRE
jgi:hypothetical protein